MSDKVKRQLNSLRLRLYVGKKVVVMLGADEIARGELSRLEKEHVLAMEVVDRRNNHAGYYVEKTHIPLLALGPIQGGPEGYAARIILKKYKYAKRYSKELEAVGAR